MICKQFNCIFVHIPKVGGQSIAQFFLSLLGLSWEQRNKLLLRYNPDPAFGPTRLAHLTASEYVSCGHIPESEFRKYYKFAFIRNPWDRIVSQYKFQGYAARFDFKSFLFKHFPKPGMDEEYRHVLPQNEFLFDVNGRLLVDFIGRFERLESDFAFVCQTLGITKTDLPHINRSSERRHYTEYYDDEAREQVRRIYKREIDMFAYSFDNKPNGAL